MVSVSYLEWWQWMSCAVGVGLASLFFTNFAVSTKHRKLRRYLWWIAVGSGVTATVFLALGIIELTQ